MAPDELHQAGDGYPAPPAHGEPGGGDMDVHDAHALALQVIPRCDEQADGEPERDQRRPAPAQPGSERTSDLQETSRIRVDMHVPTPFSEGRGLLKGNESPALPFFRPHPRSGAPMHKPLPSLRPEQNALPATPLPVASTTSFGLLRAMFRSGSVPGPGAPGRASHTFARAEGRGAGKGGDGPVTARVWPRR